MLIIMSLWLIRNHAVVNLSEVALFGSRLDEWLVLDSEPSVVNVTVIPYVIMFIGAY